MELLLLEPVFKQMIWGGSRLKDDFGYDIPGDNTGECWAISAHPHGDCTIKNTEYKGKTLSWLWENHRELFGNVQGDRFPLLIKIIDAKADLSIQVHPDDAYAAEHENGSLGKMECWYILDAKEGGTIVIGHNAKNHEEVEEMILETQQNSDITYRVYDYDRLQDGKPRALHVQQSIDVIKAPFEPAVAEHEKLDVEGAEAEKLVSCPCYTVCKATVNGTAEFDWDQPFVDISVLDGEGSFDGTPVKKGTHLIVPAGYGKMKAEGKNLMMVYSYITEK